MLLCAGLNRCHSGKCRLLCVLNQCLGIRLIRDLVDGIQPVLISLCKCCPAVGRVTSLLIALILRVQRFFGYCLIFRKALRLIAAAYVNFDMNIVGRGIGNTYSSKSPKPGDILSILIKNGFYCSTSWDRFADAAIFHFCAIDLDFINLVAQL